VKEELNKDMESFKKGIKQKTWKQKFLKPNEKIQLKVTPEDWNKWKIEF
jgi:hypothetical protein